jgi:hypothetical protein
MEILIILGFVFFATMTVFSVVNILVQISKIKDENEKDIC